MYWKQVTTLATGVSQCPALELDAQEPWTAMGASWSAVGESVSHSSWGHFHPGQATLHLCVCAEQHAGAPSPVGAYGASSLLGISHFLGQSLYKQKEKVKAELNTQVSKDTLRNRRGDKYTVLSLCRGGVFTRPQRQRWNCSCVINKSSGSLPGRAHEGWSLTLAPNSLQSCWKRTETSRCFRNSMYLELH